MCEARPGGGFGKHSLHELLPPRPASCMRKQRAEHLAIIISLRKLNQDICLNGRPKLVQCRLSMGGAWSFWNSRRQVARSPWHWKLISTPQSLTFTEHELVIHERTTEILYCNYDSYNSLQTNYGVITHNASSTRRWQQTGTKRDPISVKVKKVIPIRLCIECKEVLFLLARSGK